jgi:VWFA-related protein
MTRSIACITTLVALLFPAQPQAPAPAAQQPPTIRSRTTLVPVDVRVVDAKGNPVTDLRKDDFVVEEDGVRQEIRLFETRALTPRPPSAGPPPLRRAIAADATEATEPPQDARLFLFVFGRGRLQWPDKGIDSTMGFVRERLLPQDRVAVLAYNRATDFTTDRKRILTTLDRFKKAHDLIEAHLRQQFSGLQAVFGGTTPSKSIQAEIDAVFADPAGAAARRLPPQTPTDAALISADRRRQIDALQRVETIAGRDPSPFDAFDRNAAAATEMTLDEYARTAVQTAQDIENIYTGINYLKYLDGEKHLVFVSEGGLFLPRLENDHSIAALASDARVVLDTLQTGGLVTMDPFTRNPLGVITGVDANKLARVSNDQLEAGQSMRSLAQLTGGMAAVYTPSAKTLAQIDVTTRSGYVLAYAPSNTAWDGRFRRIKVRVNRPGVRVLARYGYYAREEYVPFDRRAFMTYSRIASAGNMTEAVQDLKVSATAEYQPQTSSLVVNLTIGSDRIAFDHGDRHRASLEVAYFAGSAKRALVGEHWQAVDLELTDANYETFKTRGVSYTQSVPVKAEPVFVKVVAYDYASDRLGTVTIRLPRK